MHSHRLGRLHEWTNAQKASQLVMCSIRKNKRLSRNEYLRKKTALHHVR
jgi:hypothetical protein